MLPSGQIDTGRQTIVSDKTLALPVFFAVSDHSKLCVGVFPDKDFRRFEKSQRVFLRIQPADKKNPGRRSFLRNRKMSRISGKIYPVINGRNFTGAPFEIFAVITVDQDDSVAKQRRKHLASPVKQPPGKPDEFMKGQSVHGMYYPRRTGQRRRYAPDHTRFRGMGMYDVKSFPPA